MSQSPASKSKDTSISLGWSPLWLVGLVLVALKAAGAIDLSWWVVLAPFYLWPAIVLGILAAMAVVTLVVLLVGAVAMAFGK